MNCSPPWSLHLWKQWVQTSQILSLSHQPDEPVSCFSLTVQHNLKSKRFTLLCLCIFQFYFLVMGDNNDSRFWLVERCWCRLWRHIYLTLMGGASGVSAAKPCFPTWKRFQVRELFSFLWTSREVFIRSHELYHLICEHYKVTFWSPNVLFPRVLQNKLWGLTLAC